MDTVALNPTPAGGDVSLGTTTAPLNEDVVKTRATKAWMGLGGTLNQDYDQMYGQIANGQENTIRDGAASALDYKRLSAAVANRNMTADDLNQILSNKVNPDTVIEQAYAQAYMNNVQDSSKRMDGNPVQVGQVTHPEQTDALTDRATDLLGLREYMITQAQNIDPEVKADPWFNIPAPVTPLTPEGQISVGSRTAPVSAALNWATLGIYGGLREEYLMRGNTPETSRLAGIFEGSNLQEQAQELYRLPAAQAQQLFLKGFNRLRQEDPTLAQQWAMSMAGMSSEDIVARNAMSAINITAGLGAAKGIKAGLESIGKAQLGQTVGQQLARGAIEPLDINAVKASMDALKAEPLPLETPELWAVQRSMEDILKAAPEHATKANIAEAIGDTREAAAQRLIEYQKNPNPEQEAFDTLFDSYKVQRQDIENNPGTLSREELTRTLDAIDGTAEASNKAMLDDASNLVRLPELAENGYRAIIGRVAEYFKGLENTILNYDVFINRLTNTVDHVVTMGRYGGGAFSSEQEAVNAAKNRKIAGVKVYGKDPNTVYIPQEAVFPEAQTLKQTLWKDQEVTRIGGPQTVGGLRTNLQKIKVLGEKGTRTVPETELTDRDVKARPEFSFEKKENGQYTFHLDDTKGTRSEILPSVEPRPGHISFDMSTGKFGEPVPYGPQIAPKGLGWFIKWHVPLNEQDDFIRDNHLVTGPRTKSSSSGRGFVSDLFNGSFLGYFRLPQDTLSAAEVENRAKLVYAQSKYFKLIMRDMKYVQDLYNGLAGQEGRSLSYLGNLTGKNKQVWNDFKRALTVAQKYPDPETGLPGYYFRTPAEIQHFWQSAFQRPASFAEQQAYLAVQRMDHVDWVFRNIGVYKNKARLGVMEHTLMTAPKEEGGDVIRSKPFEGSLIDRLPGGDVPIAVHTKDGTIKYYSSVTSKKALQEAFDRGEFKGVKVYNPDTYPLGTFDDQNRPVRVLYVLSDNMETRPISYKQVGQRGGGHWDYNYDYYIKQPITRKFKIGNKTHIVYEGDATFSPIKNHADGQVFIENLNKIVKALRNKDEAGARAIHMAYSDQDWNEFKSAFYPKKNETTGEIMPARFNLDEDFRVIPKGFTAGEWDKDFMLKYKALGKYQKFINAANGEQNPARNYMVEYTSQRDSHDLFEPYNTGTITNPFYKFQPAELVDPLTAQTRALRRIIQSASADDYKYMAVEHWLQENMKYLDVESRAAARHSPFATFMNNDFARRWRWDLMGQAAQSNRYKIMKLLGMPTFMDSQIHMVKQSLADELFKTENPLKKAALIPPTWMLSKIHSPANFLRGLAFHENLGLFNWMQLAAQNAAYVNFFAMSPGHAIPGVFGSWMHLASRINKLSPILKGLSKAAETFGWKPGEWEEAMRLYDSTGFSSIGNTLAIHDPDAKFLQSSGSKLLQLGSKYFFELAEQNVRHGAWYTAYHEYKRAFPNQAINSVEAGKILRRANDLYANMGRDSKTALNTGVTGVSLQFFKYIENIGQLFLSKRIGDVFGKENTAMFRAKQRAQMIAMYSLFFGPMGATGLSLLPINDVIRKQTLQDGYVPGNNFWSTLLMEGPASMAGAYASGWWRTGQADMTKGTFYNFNNRYGANGYQLLRDLLEGSPTFWQVILGASGSTLSNNLASLSPFVYAWKSAYNDEADNPFKLTYSDWFDGLRNINSMRYADRLRYAIEYGKWLDRHGRPQQEVGKIDAVFRTLLGVNDVNLDDLFLMRQIKSDETENYKKAAQEFQHYRRLQDEAIANKDEQQALQFGKNAIFALHSRGVPPEEAAKIFREDRSLNRETQSQIYDQFYRKLVPTYRQPSAGPAYQEHYRQTH